MTIPDVDVLPVFSWSYARALGYIEAGSTRNMTDNMTLE